MIENIKYLPRKTIIQLFNEVFDQLPEILADVAPDGWESSAYYPLFHFSPEEEGLKALLNELTKVQYRQRFGVLTHQDTHIVDFESLTKNFKFTYRPQPFDPEQELCSLFVDALSCMCHDGKFYHKDSDFFYEVNPPVVQKAAEIVARDKGIVTEKPYQLPFIPWEKRILIHEANLMPLMRHLFKALPATDFTWEYLDYEAFDFIEYCNTYQSGNQEQREPYYASKRDRELGITSIPNLDDYFKQVEKELPSDAVVAYSDTFGKWPEGFPPAKDHYLRWYKKFKRIQPD
ncbi:hypothetical protein GCM10011386_32630 [Parapedobacter defluvii]|uniref:Uncharacterized protein n=1 Tax=Parapedobacter defluvii TaxID=2045106 RepID=A0ABQ1MCU6_9SPHI|nr:hypothetical protein [Parapedobacter defluvii]GGC38000.1 hypothetical protein GCM10011386_32630 [Parapedobacter defluvii]